MPMIPLVKNGFYASRGFTPLVRGNGEGNGGAPEPDPVWSTVAGNPVSFTAYSESWPLKQLSVAFSPVQDLHGYDSPWPAGGGKNLCDYSQLVNGTYNGSGTFVPHNNYVSTPKIEIVGGESYTWTSHISFTAAYATYWDSEGEAISQKSFSTGTTATAQTPANAQYVAFSGNYATSTSVDSVKPTQVEKGSSPTAWTPYSNICPISGWDGVTVWGTGKNMLAPSMIIEKKYIRAAGTPLGVEVSDNSFSCTDFLPVSPNTQYTTVIPEYLNAAVAGLVYYDGNNEAISGVSLKSQGGAVYTFTTPATAAYVRFCWTNSQGNNAQLAYGTVTAYVPYNGTSISISFGSTLYSGTLDVLTGVVTVTWGLFDTSVDNYNIYKNNASNPDDWLYYFSNPSFDGSDYKNVMSDRFETVSGYPTGQNGGKCKITGHLLYVNLFGLIGTNDATTAKTWMLANAPQFAYKLSTPITIQLTPSQLSSLAGDNVAWASTNGDLEITYRSA